VGGRPVGKSKGTMPAVRNRPGAPVQVPSQANQIALGTFPGWTVSPSLARPLAPALMARSRPLVHKSQPTGCQGNLTIKKPPTVTSETVAMISIIVVTATLLPAAVATKVPAARPRTIISPMVTRRATATRTQTAVGTAGEAAT